MGNWMAWYHNAKVSEEHRIDATELMPHEDVVETSFEEEAMKRRQRQQ
ncbi:hypothetical protein [Acinetobacter sp. NIPH 298]|nr:hypothetical protein [Acinetobacter sp. NIPH 298]ENW95973.1 hypothetical protein F903_01741 [Acinetobacter sp. NIPH 298]